MKIIIHCSDSSWGNSSAITEWHLQRGWKTIGYHYVILNGQLSGKHFNAYFDGHIETGRPLDDDNKLSSSEFGAHAKGQNDESVGICLIGKSGQFTHAQLDNLIRLIGRLKVQFKDIEIYQHSDFEPEKPYCAGLRKDFIDQLILHNAIDYKA